MFKPLLILLCVVSTSTIAALAQTTTLNQETSNNTAACGASGMPTYCQQPFTPMSDTHGVYNPAPGNVSTVDTHELLYPGATTRLFTHFQPWFCMGSSTSTGTGSSCGSHIQVGYNSADANTVHGQIDDMMQRGFNGTVVDYYGANNAAIDAATSILSSDVASRCTGSQNCSFYYALMYDQGAFQWNACPRNGNGIDQTQCIINAMSSDFDYMNANYFGTAGYVRFDAISRQISSSGSPVLLFFICESCFTNPTPDWKTIWAALRQHVASYGANTPNVFFVYENATGFTHTQSDGAYAWVNHYGSNDPYGTVYLDNFYDTAKSATQQNPALITIGGQWKGFDNTNASWVGSTPSVTGQQCGKTWLQTFQQITHNNDFSSSYQLPFSGVITWNDYEEGTEIETGIDNCLSLSASISGASVAWTPTFSDASGSENTVHHYVVFDSADGINLTQIATVSSGTHSLDLTPFALAAGPHTLFVKAVGQPSILNKLSNAVSYTVGTPVALQSIALNPSSVIGGSSATGTVTLTQPAPAGGLTVSLSSSATAVSVPAQLVVAAGATNATFTASTQAVGTSTTSSISASYSGNTVSVNLTVTPAALSQASLSPTSVGGTLTSTLTLQLNGPAPVGGAIIALASDTSAATVPATVTIPAGSNSAKAPVTSTAVRSTTAANITATYAGASRTTSLTIYTAPASVTFSTSSVTGGRSVAVTVNLTGPAPSGGEVVSLTSSSSYAPVPSSITVAAGSASARFNLNTKKVPSTVYAIITATGKGVAKSATLKITH